MQDVQESHWLDAVWRELVPGDRDCQPLAVSQLLYITSRLHIYPYPYAILNLALGNIA